MSRARTAVPAGGGPIGFFDSGVGGLSILRAAHVRLPGTELVYVADQAFAPYGTRSAAYVLERALVISAALYASGCRLIVVACNTATATTIDTLRARYPDCRFVGVEPGVKPATRLVRRGAVGLLATPQTLRSDRVGSLLRRFARRVRVVPVACPGWADRVERGELGGASTRAALARRLTRMRRHNVRALVLGCTHYSFLAPLLAAMVGPNVHIIDTAAAVAARIQALRPRMPPAASFAAAPPVRLLTTGSTAALARQAARLLPGVRVAVTSLPPR